MNYELRKKIQNSAFSIQHSRRRQAAFTLMELMVVVSLILIILGVGMTNYITQIKRSRDARRKSDLEQIRAALEMYRADEGTYPVCGNWSYLTESGWDCGSGTGERIPWGHNRDLGCSCLPRALAGYSGGTTIYLKPLPIDPAQYDCACQRNRAYYYSSNGTTYTLYTKLEITDDKDINCPSGCGPMSFANYRVTNP